MTSFWRRAVVNAGVRLETKVFLKCMSLGTSNQTTLFCFLKDFSLIEGVKLCAAKFTV